MVGGNSFTLSQLSEGGGGGGGGGGAQTVRFSDGGGAAPPAVQAPVSRARAVLAKAASSIKPVNGLWGQQQ